MIGRIAAVGGALGLVLMLSGCNFNNSAVCDDRGRSEWKAVSMAFAGCSLTPPNPIPKIVLPVAYRDDSVEWQLVPVVASATAQPAFAIPPSPVGDAVLIPAVAKSGGKPDGIDPAPDSGDLRPPSEWWRLFGSDELNRLEEMALSSNHTLKAAMARIDQSQALAGMAAGALMPEILPSAKAQSNAPNGGIGTRVSVPDGKSQRLYTMGVTASYEIDFWGKNRAAVESALAVTQSSIYDRQTIAVTLAADVATNYFNYLTFCDRIAVAQSNVTNVTDVLATVQKRFTIGEGSDIEVQQQKTALEQAKGVVPVLTLAKERARLTLAVLAGSMPEALHLEGTTLATLTIPMPPATLPSSLLANRPDIRKSESDMIASNSDIGFARGKLLPSFTISAETGFGGNYLDKIFSPSGWYYILATSISGILFDNGKALSEVELRKAIYSERTETYRQTILTALRDVEDALASIRLDAETEAAQQAALLSANRAYDLAQQALQIGTSEYLTILETERTRYNIEDTRVQARQDRLVAAISLFRGLGGGIEPPSN